jgi:hypothetical protein
MASHLDSGMAACAVALFFWLPWAAGNPEIDTLKRAQITEISSEASLHS